MTYEEKEIYVHKFEKKQDLQLNFYMDEADIAFFGIGADTIIHIDDIVLDIHKRIKKGVILEWYNYESGRHDFLNDNEPEKITYQQYLNGKR